MPTAYGTVVIISLHLSESCSFRTRSEQTGRGYQTLINEALKGQVGLTEQALTPEAVRRIVREELALQG